MKFFDWLKNKKIMKDLNDCYDFSNLPDISDEEKRKVAIDFANIVYKIAFPVVSARTYNNFKGSADFTELNIINVLQENPDVMLLKTKEPISYVICGGEFDSIYTMSNVLGINNVMNYIKSKPDHIKINLNSENNGCM